MDNQNYAEQLYSGISNEIGLLEKNIEEYPASSVVRFMWLYDLKKNSDPRFKEAVNQTGIYLNNPLWMEYQLSKSEFISNTVNEEISQNPIIENNAKEIKNENLGAFNEQKSEQEIAPEKVNEEISHNPVLENESTEIKNEEINDGPSDENQHENPVDFNEQKTEEEVVPSTVNEEISHNPILENESTEIKNEEINDEPSDENQYENPVDFNEQKTEEEVVPSTINEEISHNPILENVSTEIKNEEINDEPFDENQHENPVDFNEQKTEQEVVPSTVNEEISHNPILENESTEIKNEEITNERSAENQHENSVDFSEQKSEEGIVPSTVNEEISQNPISENEEDNINEDEHIIQENPPDENQIVSDKPFNRIEKGSEEMSIPFEPLHTVDYFASQGIKLSEEALANDHLGQQVKSFTAWLKSMKKLHPGQIPEQNEVIEKIIQSSSEASNQNANVLTEAMAEVLVKQGKREKAVEMYEKLSLINPSKSAYFAGKIEILKTI